jgi:hypothetical protein
MTLPRLSRPPLLALVPPAVLLCCLLFWAVDVLNWDEWIIWTRVLEKLRHGSFGLLDLAAQENEQRNLAARLMGLALLPAFGLSRWPEYLLNLLLAGGCVLLAARLFRRVSPDREPPLPIFSLLAFSLLQWETFSVGINSSVLLPVLGLWLGSVLAWAGPPTFPRISGLALVGVLPSFSFVNGLFFWPCLWPLLLYRAEARSQRRLVLLAWPLLGALAWLAYFAGYQRPGHHPSVLAALASPLRFTGYVLAYLGGAVVSDRNLLALAVLAGGFSLVLLAALLRTAARKHAWATALPWLPVTGFGLCSALATAAGRSGFGLGQALESRYATFSGAYWMALAALFLLLRAHLPERPGIWLRRGLACCLALFLLSSLLSAIVLRNRHVPQEAARRELYRLTDTAALQAIFPDPAYLAAHLPLFLEQRLGPYHFLRPMAEYQHGSASAGSFEAAAGRGLDDRLCGVQVRGQLDRAVALPVLFTSGSGLAGVAMSDSQGRFALFLPDTALPEGTLTLHALALERDTLWPLLPEAGVDVVNTPCAAEFRIDKKFLAR